MRWRKHLLIAIAALAGVTALLAALLLLTPPGVSLVGRLAAPLSGGLVRITGLSGNWIGNIRAQEIVIADGRGTWLKAAQVVLRWSPLSLVSSHVAVQTLDARRVEVLRRPVPDADTRGETPHVSIAQLTLPHIALAPPVIGQAVRMAASGNLDYAAATDFKADLLVTRQASSDRYRITGSIHDGVVRGDAIIQEGADGILGRLGNLPGLGSVNLTARAGGDKHANTLSLDLSAGPLRAQGRGTVQMAAQSAALDFSIAAPALSPRPGLGWQSLSGTARMRGRFDAPNLAAQVILSGGQMDGLGAKRLVLDLTGRAGRARLGATVEGLVIPGRHPALFAAAPVWITAEADLKAATRPVTFRIDHPLAALKGSVQTRGQTLAQAELTVPALAPFAALEQADLRGNAMLNVTMRQDGPNMTLSANGRMHTQGTAMPARLLGGNASLDISAALRGSDITQSRIQLKGGAITADIAGSLRQSVLQYRLALAMNDVSRLAAPVRGTLDLRGTVEGPIGEAVLSASGTASVGTKGFSRQRIALEIQATGLPTLREGRLRMEGSFNGAPLLVRGTLKGEKSRQASLTASWKSLDARAQVTIGAALAGRIHAALGRLSDIEPFTGLAAAGSAEANVTLQPRAGKTDAAVTANAQGLAIAGIQSGAITLSGTVTDLLSKPVTDLDLVARDLAVQGFRGGLQASVKGPLTDLAVMTGVDMKEENGATLKADARARLDLTGKQVTISQIDGAWRGVSLTLQAPATISYANGLAVDHLDARLGKGTLAGGGTLMPKLSVTATLRNISLEDVRPLLPAIGARGTLSGDAALSGTLAAPQGRITLRGRDLRTAFSSRAMPPAALDASLQLSGDRATVTASLAAGNSAKLSLDGTLALNDTGLLALHAGGTADLALLDPLLAVDGRRARGTLTFDTNIGGSLSAPRITGNGTLASGEFQDHARGLRVTDITATIRADGSRIVLTGLTGRAGPGAITASGSIILTEPGLPVEMTLEATNARPIVSDLITATLTGSLKLTGAIRQQMTLAGRVRLTGGEINLPDNFPPEVAVLNVRRRGRPVLPPPPAQASVALDIALQTQGPIFVRGHGVDAEMGGGIHITGPSTALQVSGGLRMTRGSYSVAGQRLDFTTGNVRFDGMGLRGRIDPTLDFVAQTVSAGITATLAIGGYASSPRITLSSSPSLPQDEVIAHLLFQQSVKQLTPLQLASIAQAAAAMGGIGGGFNPLSTVRRTLGLDRLSVGSATGGATGSESQTTVEAGRYVTRNVYVGVKQNLSGGTQTQVQVDITRRLKAQATVSAGTNAPTAQGNSALQDNGSSIGLSYLFEY